MQRVALKVKLDVYPCGVSRTEKTLHAFLGLGALLDPKSCGDFLNMISRSLALQRRLELLVLRDAPRTLNYSYHIFKALPSNERNLARN